jgi:iron complex outermembrane receptor protein
MEKYAVKAAAVFVCCYSLATATAQPTEEIIVVGVVPLGAGVDRDTVPFPVQVGSAEDLKNSHAQSIADFLKQGFSSITLNDAQNNPLQPDLQYRGFSASPLLGLAQGLAVYQNGNRINEPLGDAVNWDLLPQSAIHRITLSGGANPLFGQNSLGGSLAIDMKNGFNFQGNNVELSGGSFGRTRANAEIGGPFKGGGDNSDGNKADEGFAYYLNVEYFDEEGWRDASDSDAMSFYGSLAWRSQATQAEFSYQYSKSDLAGNGSSPVELLALNREAIFTGPDITANDMYMVHFDLNHELSSNINMAVNTFYRKNDTDAFNGDGSEFRVCHLGDSPTLIDGLEKDDVAEVGLDDDELCNNQFANVSDLQTFLNLAVAQAGEAEGFNLQGFDLGDLTGTGVLSDQAINNISSRRQESKGLDFQASLKGTFFGYGSHVVIGASYFNGESNFNSVLELSNLDPLSRLTRGLGTGTFVNEGTTSINTVTETASVYFTSIVDISETIVLTVSARGNRTDVNLRDRSGIRPELNGSHRFTRLNPSLGMTWQATKGVNFYGSYSESSRAPTPIELACNEGVFDLAVKFAIERGDDPDDVNFECRLPNAFLADPPLSDVVAESFELGARGTIHGLIYSAGVFYTTSLDDILFQTTGRSTGLFANVDKTRRKGFESSLRGTWHSLTWMTSYSFIDATFEADFKALSPNHTFANEVGEILISRGDSIPGIPQNQFKVVADYVFDSGLNIGLDLVSNSGQFIRGDESNQLDEVEGYFVVNLRAQYQLTEDFELFARIDNVFDEEFETFGLLGENPSELEVPIIENLTIPRFLGAAAPRAGFVGARYSF